MNTQKYSSNIFLAIIAVFAVGVLTGCQYCQPLLMAALVIGLIYKGIKYSPLEASSCADIKHLKQKL